MLVSFLQSQKAVFTGKHLHLTKASVLVGQSGKPDGTQKEKQNKTAQSFKMSQIALLNDLLR